MDLIDRGRLKAAYLKEHVGKPGKAFGLICEAETVETRAVKKAKWIVRGFRYVCDRCGHDESVSSKFCPNCGAKMDVEVEE